METETTAQEYEDANDASEILDEVVEDPNSTARELADAFKDALNQKNQYFNAPAENKIEMIEEIVNNTNVPNQNLDKLINHPDCADLNIEGTMRQARAMDDLQFHADREPVVNNVLANRGKPQL